MKIHTTAIVINSRLKKEAQKKDSDGLRDIPNLYWEGRDI